MNIGKEINTPKSDKDYKVSTDGKFAYFSKFTENNHADIYISNYMSKVIGSIPPCSLIMPLTQ